MSAHYFTHFLQLPNKNLINAPLESCKSICECPFVPKFVDKKINSSFSAYFI